MGPSRGESIGLPGELRSKPFPGARPARLVRPCRWILLSGDGHWTCETSQSGVFSNAASSVIPAAITVCFAIYSVIAFASTALITVIVFLTVITFIASPP